ncbi:MAG: CHAD domain-containing protein [Blastocatellia bacterium]|nr:CHAD domain-containing protein [Blastocatellia bacterium]
MKQAKEIVGTDTSKNALEWIRETLQRHFAEVLALRDDALDSVDIEGVHQMRVVIRRLRSALCNFSFLMKSNPFKESKKDLKRLANTLGTARDQDVAILALEKLHNKAKNERIKKNLAEKIEKHRIVREEIQKELNKILDVSLLENLRENFSKALNKVNKKNVRVAKLTAGEAGREVISKNIHEFCRLEGKSFQSI